MLKLRTSSPSILCGFLTLLLLTGFAMAQSPIDEESPWPRVRTTNGHTVTLYQPQVESWTSNSFIARAAVELKMAGAKSDLFGCVWITAQGSVDRANRRVTLDHVEVSKGRFPQAPDQGSNALAIVRAVVPSGARTVSLDYLITALGFAQAAARQGPQGLKNTPPEIVWATNRTVLVLIDGEPVLQPIPDQDLQRVVNTPALLLFDKAGGKFYLAGDDLWFTATSIQGAWSLAQSPPAAVSALTPAPSRNEGRAKDEPVPRVLVRTHPAELLMTSGLPDFRPIRGTTLQYAADTDSQLFFNTADRAAYLLLSGRWFKAESLRGPWSYVAPRDLPADFARIPAGSAQAVALASVPNTPQAELAVLANSVPTTATVSRRDAAIQLSYDGEPKFKPIEGTRLSYAVNAQLPVILASSNYYALDNGVWFVATSPTGPWQVATEVPEEVYSIPPNSPVYYATFAHVYQSSDEEVEVGYTPGYQGTYEEDGTVVYGTGWDYDPWYGDVYYGWGWTWGYSYWYVPWYQWWVWRDWWQQPGGLRSALIENVYDRWQGRNGIIHYDKPATTAARAAAAGFSGYPALYGRFRGATRPAALIPPANAVALNPYARPQTAVRQGELPRGAQLLTTLRQSPSGGRDLYASTDGHVYQRKNDGWYQRQAGGQWKFAAPIQGNLERSSLPATRGAAQPSGGNVYRPVAARDATSRRASGLGYRAPDAGVEVRAQEIAALEREYYARSLAQLRAQNWRGYANRPMRAGRRR
jgi:hypothetical protein